LSCRVFTESKNTKRGKIEKHKSQRVKLGQREAFPPEVEVKGDCEMGIERNTPKSRNKKGKGGVRARHEVGGVKRGGKGLIIILQKESGGKKYDYTVHYQGC